MPLSKKSTNKLPEMGYFSSIPAEMIDIAYRCLPKGRWGRARSFIKIRAIYAFLFLPLLSIDLVTSFFLGLRYAISSFFTSDELQEKRLAQQKKYTTIFSKSLYALAACWLGFISPKLIAFYFTPEHEKKNTIKAGGSLYETEGNVEEPKTIEELQTIIKEAALNGSKIMPVGAGRSQGKQFLPEGKNGIAINLKNFNTIEIKKNKKIAIVGAGTLWSEIQLEANKHNLALKVMQASNVFSVGGSIGTNIHGWDHINGVLSNTILSMDIINAKGELQTLTPEDK